MIIIGSGLAGYTLVREIRKLNPTIEITLYTENSGDYYSKPQLSSALTHHKSPEQLVLINAQKFASQFQIQLISHTKIQHLSDLGEINNRPIILATGANPLLLPQYEKCHVFTVNHLEEYKLFRQTLENSVQSSSDKLDITIIGAGLVGCEFANDLANSTMASQFNITVVAPEAYPLAKFIPEAVGIELQNALAEKGVHWALNQFFDPQKIKPKGLILSAIGLKPNIAFAQSMGLKTQLGIVVDRYLQTSHHNIYAVGDCAEFDGKIMPFVAPIAIGARALAKTLLGSPTPVEYPPMPIYIKTSSYPIVMLTPNVEHSGKWHFEKSGINEKNQTGIRALFYNENNELKGFVLGGSCTSEVNDYIGKIQ